MKIMDKLKQFFTIRQLIVFIIISLLYYAIIDFIITFW